MTQLQEFLFKLTFGEIKKIRDYMLKRYCVYCGTMESLEQAISNNIPDEDILVELREILA